MIIPTIFFEITDKCNLQCSFCCKSWRKYQSCTMSYNDLDTIIKISKKYSKISGGEPGIVKDKTFYYIEHEICPIGMNTNLSLWSQDEMLYIKKRKVSITTNIPSLDFNIHTKITNISKEQHKNILNNLKYLNENDYVTIVVNEINKNQFDKDIIQYVIKYGIKNFLLSPMIYNNKDSINYNEIISKIELFYNKHRNLNIKTIGNIKNCIIPGSHTCTAGLNRFVILSNKDVVPCAWNNNNILGNIDTTSWNDIMLKGLIYYNSFNNEEKKLCKGYIENKQDNNGESKI